MFIGGGSAGTAGGIKVGTFAVLLLVIVAELRGDPDANLYDRRLPTSTIRQALSVALLSVAAVVASTLGDRDDQPVHARPDPLRGRVRVLDGRADHRASRAHLHSGQQVILVLLMFAGRLGPVTFASALVLRERQRLFRRPEGRPLIG